jgi:hypothetical protein
MIQLTADPSIKQNLQLAADRKRIMYQIYPIGTGEGSPNITQQRLYSVDLTNGLVEHWGKDFQGNIASYTTKSLRDIHLREQLGINAQFYSQISSTAPSVLHVGFNGTYDSISSSATNSVAFIFSSFAKVQEAFFISNIDELTSPTAVTSENSQYDQIVLPEAQAYQWKNEDDNRTIKGIL